MRHVSLIACAVSLALSCTTARMRVDPALADVTALDVSGANPRTWNTPIRFGPWATSVAREGGTWGFGYRLLGIDAGFAFQPYRLVVSNGPSSVQAECVTRAAVLSRNDLSVDPSFGRIPALACGFRGAGDGTLRLRTTATNAEEGEIEFGAERWTIRSVRDFEGSAIPSGDPLGYEIRDDGRVVAAIETINRGRVWIDPSVDAEDAARLAAVATALLLYEPAGGD
ncbi:MAG TPA: hypothetical protein VFT12_11445 [Thermoanaerobaculia bacterium]|nr:hypothetical protein [Thermoanaerobaculia bacterium]